MILVILDLAVAEEDECDSDDDQDVIKKAGNVCVIPSDNDVHIHQGELQYEQRECGEVSGLTEQHRKADKADIAHHGEDPGKGFVLERNAEQVGGIF